MEERDGHTVGAGDKAPGTKNKVLFLKRHSLHPTGAGDAAPTAGAEPSLPSHESTGVSLFILGKAQG